MVFSQEQSSERLFILGFDVELRHKGPVNTAPLSVVLSKGVQQLMDELDLPPDRANLFEVEYPD